MKLQPSRGLAYWVGVAQSDGHFYITLDKRGYTKFYMILRIGKKSLPMMHKFRRLSEFLFNRKAIISKVKNKCFNKCFSQWIYKIGIKEFLKDFVRQNIVFGDPPSPPNWCIGNPKFFGAYLAGLIDGDGDVRVHRPKYPQCAIRINNGHPQNELESAIEEIMNCSAHINYRQEKIVNGKKIHGHNYILEFFISPKNYQFVEKFVLKHITIPYKKEKITLFIKHLEQKIKSKIISFPPFNLNINKTMNFSAGEKMNGERVHHRISSCSN